MYILAVWYRVMDNWWQKASKSKISLIFTAILVACGMQETQGINSATAIEAIAISRFAVTDYQHDSSSQSPGLLVQNAPVCNQIKPGYQKVYGFETESFHIRICQLEQNYFYYRQSKSDPNDILLIPAKIVFGGSVFEAVDGGTTYFVGTDRNGYYSSVMRNDNEIIVEPEINLSPTTATANNQDLVSPASKTSNQSQVCIRHQLVLQPVVNNWQSLGDRLTPTDSHNVPLKRLDFRYDSNPFTTDLAPKTATIATKNLAIAPIDSKDKRLCVNSVADRELEQFTQD